MLIRYMNFTAHNILLPNGEHTMCSGSVATLAESNVWRSIHRSLDLFLPQSQYDYSNMRVADLGCLEGGYALEFAKLGFNVLGIEARGDNITKCNFIKHAFALPNLSFVKDDVRNISNYGTFDIILNYGLLYHLNDPVNFLKLSAGHNSKLLFLNTHFAPERDIRYALGPVNKYLIGPLQKRTHLLERTMNYRLSSITTNEGYAGRWYREWSPRDTSNKIEGKLWASYNNHRSFWLRKKDLTKALNDAGYEHVFERFDFTGDIMPHNYTEKYNRTMFVALK